MRMLLTARSSSRNVRTSQDFQGLLQGINLCLPSCDALVPRHAAIDALRHQSVVVALSGEQLILRGFKVRCLLLDLRLGGYPVSLVHLDFSHFGRLAPLAVHHETLVCLCRSKFCRVGVGLEGSEIRCDHFEQTQNPVLGLVLLPLLGVSEGLHVIFMTLVNLTLEIRVCQGVPLIGAHLDASLQAPLPGGRRPLLQERGCRGSLRIVVLENRGRCGNGSLRCLCIFHRGGICGFLLRSQICGFLHCSIQTCDILRQVGCFICQCRNCRLIVFDRRSQTIDVRGKLVPCNLTLAHLLVAEALMFRILVCLLQKTLEQTVNQLLHLSERIGHD